MTAHVQVIVGRPATLLELEQACAAARSAGMGDDAAVQLPVPLFGDPRLIVQRPVEAVDDGDGDA